MSQLTKADLKNIDQLINLTNNFYLGDKGMFIESDVDLLNPNLVNPNWAEGIRNAVVHYYKELTKIFGKRVMLNIEKQKLLRVVCDTGGKKSFDELIVVRTLFFKELE